MLALGVDMAKSDDFPGRPVERSAIRGMQPPAEVAEPNLGITISEMLKQQKKEGANKLASVSTTPIEASSNEETISPAMVEELKSNVGRLNDTGRIENIPIDSIVVSPYQPRLIFSDSAIEELANSISAIGLVKPLTVRPIGNGTYELVGGERRWRAHKTLGREVVTAYVRSVSDSMARILALTDNEGQEPLTEYERGRSYQKIISSGDEMSLRSLARRIGVNHSSVSRCLLLLELTAPVLAILDVTPDLIGGKWAKDFVAFGKNEPDLLLASVIHMRDDRWNQEQALRWIHGEVSNRSKIVEAQPYFEKKIDGVGTLKIDSKKLELRFSKGFDSSQIEEQFEVFLKTVLLPNSRCE
jgi:ParB family chromosome partitioning protein